MIELIRLSVICNQKSVSIPISKNTYSRPNLYTTMTNLVINIINRPTRYTAKHKCLEMQTILTWVSCVALDAWIRHRTQQFISRITHKMKLGVIVFATAYWYLQHCLAYSYQRFPVRNYYTRGLGKWRCIYQCVNTDNIKLGWHWKL